MWNNLDYASEKLNNCEHFRIHKEHLERLIQAKPAIENSPPLKPFFIYDKASKREERRQELEKINYQNKILIERIDSIGRKPSPYSNCMLKPSIFPALNKSKSTYNDKKNKGRTTPMKISEVRIRKVENDDSKLKAVASITIDESFVVHDIKIIEGIDKLFIAMPSRKTPEGEFKDIAHPINAEMRESIQKLILDEYYKALENETAE